MVVKEKKLKLIPKALKEFIQLETAGGIVLFAAAVLALILDNSPYRFYYQKLFNIPLGIEFNGYQFYAALNLWINDGLMTIFFFLVGLEIKREILEGELNTLSKISLPGIAALGGMVLPALIYIAINHADHYLLRGWAIPAPTDIAFALAVLSLLGRRIPISLKIFLTALAIFDDVGAIIIISIFYVGGISLPGTAVALVCILVLWILNRQSINSLWPYFLVGLVLWCSILKTGVHPTISGVILALAIPLRTNNAQKGKPLLRKLEHKLHPIVAFIILPLFGFANAGISFADVQWHSLLSSLSLGIIAGLFIGKQLGVFFSSFLAIKLGLATIPHRARWISLYGVSLICGIGFTMSLFIGTLAFGNENIEYICLVRFAVMFGSLLSGLAGYFLLRYSETKKF